MVNQGALREQANPVLGSVVVLYRRRVRWFSGWRWWILLAVMAWLSFATGMLFVAVTRDGVKLPAFLAIYLLLTVLGSLIAFLITMFDKRRSMTEQPRVSERTLHVLAALGGWPGLYLARRMFRHKTLKLSFRAVSWAIIAGHAAIIGYGFWSGWYWLALQVLLGWT